MFDPTIFKQILLSVTIDSLLKSKHKNWKIHANSFCLFYPWPKRYFKVYL